MSAALHGDLHLHDQATGGGGVATDRYSPAIIVGVETSGDTIAECHYLDPGDGTGLEAALAQAAASPGEGDVRLRRGFIDFNTGAAGNPFTIPAGVTLKGAGNSVFGTTGTPGSYIQTRSSGDQGVFIVGEGAVLRDLAIGVPLPVAATAGSTAVVNALQVAYAQIHNVAVQFQGNLTAPTAALLTLRRAFAANTPLIKATPWLGVDYRNCYAQALSVWSLEDAGVAADPFYGFFNAGFAGGLVSMDRGSQYDECMAEGLDVGIRCFQSRCGIRNPNLLFNRVEGLQFFASQCESHGGQVVVVGTANGAAILVSSGTLSRAVIDGLFVDGLSLGGTCIRVVADVALTITDCQIVRCRTLNGAIGLLLDPNGGTVDFTLVGDNDLRVNTTPFSNLGTNTVDTGNSV